jgi:hypothetical protein
VLAALELDLLSPAAIQHATNLAMEYFDKQRKAEPEAAPALSTALAEIDKRESEVREQFKSGKLPASVFKSWIGEFTKEREALNRPPVSEVPPRVSRSEFIRAYRSAVERERESKRHHSSFQERMRAAPDVQQCYDLAGEWDYLAVVVARSMAHCQAILGELFLDAPNVKRFDTLFVFGTVKRGLDIPMRQSERSR